MLHNHNETLVTESHTNDLEVVTRDVWRLVVELFHRNYNCAQVKFGASGAVPNYRKSIT